MCRTKTRLKPQNQFVSQLTDSATEAVLSGLALLASVRAVFSVLESARGGLQAMTYET